MSPKYLAFTSTGEDPPGKPTVQPATPSTSAIELDPPAHTTCPAAKAKTTLPVGVRVAGDWGVTVAVKVTGCPVTTGPVGDALTTVVLKFPAADAESDPTATTPATSAPATTAPRASRRPVTPAFIRSVRALATQRNERRLHQDAEVPRQ